MKLMTTQAANRMYSYQPIPLCYDKNVQSAVQYKLDLNAYCIKKPQDTFFMHISNTNLTAWGIDVGDVLVVERNTTPSKGDLVVVLDGDKLSLYEVFSMQPNQWVLFPLDSTKTSLYLTSLDEVQIQGVVTNTIHQFRRRHAA
ncbi:LexA family protein [Spirabiliibacterium falconis]|uniref:LexA family protein n=1 Tax=Spirabiliibacterium falconis TaxID=572023 RepID=UPI001AAD8016|nr:S24 family peptidase [Spirabiliibacterium falconis]MBE2893797.1 DNA polymerase V subunit UmuD [Spirabiliibacterium falconis]